MAYTLKSEEQFSWFDMVKAMWYFLREDRKKYVIFSILVIIIYTYTLVPIFIVGLIVDFFTTYKQGDSLTTFYIYTAVLSISYFTVSTIRIFLKRAMDFLGTDTVYRAKVEGFEKLMDFSVKWHQNENTGNKVQRIQTGVKALKDFMREIYSAIFTSGIAMIGVLIIFLFLDFKFTLFLILYIVLFFAIEIFFYQKIQSANDLYNKYNEKSSGTYFESANNVLTIKTLGAKDTVKSNVNNSEELARQHTKMVSVYGFRKWQFFQLLSGIAIGVFILLLGNEVVNGNVKVGLILVYFTYFFKLRDASQDATELVAKLIEYKSGIARMMPIFWTEENVDDGKDPFPEDWKKIVIQKANFRYKTNEDDFNIKDLNIEIGQYEKIGIVGHSGSGKSTLAKLLLGVYQIESGVFKIGDKNYYEIKHSDITKHISTVLQETELFNLTLKENITMMKETDPELMAKVIHISQLDEVIQNLPNGIDTMIGEKGYKLSGGERQRLGIARAIYSNAEILVLDEATSALDSKTESLIQKAIETELTQKTLIIIAHRLSTLRNVNKIYVFEKGGIIEQGSFQDLIRENGKFAEMYKLQQNTDNK
jgi:ABC-type multidrug transport system fused ATPase/permease subunit